jgi:hypothetical protein
MDYTLSLYPFCVIIYDFSSVSAVISVPTGDTTFVWNVSYLISPFVPLCHTSIISTACTHFFELFSLRKTLIYALTKQKTKIFLHIYLVLTYFFDIKNIIKLKTLTNIFKVFLLITIIIVFLLQFKSFFFKCCLIAIPLFLRLL